MFAFSYFSLFDYFNLTLDSYNIHAAQDSKTYPLECIHSESKKNEIYYKLVDDLNV